MFSVSKLVRVLATAVFAVSSACQLTVASASDYPSRPIRLVVGQPPGGPNDIGARLFADKLRTAIGQTVIVENKPGAATQIAISYVVRSKPDGYTLLYGGNTLGSLPFTSKVYDMDWTRDLTPIAVLAGLPLGIAVSSSVDAKDLNGFLADLRANPGKRFYASLGSSDVISMELMRRAGGLQFDSVRYNGAAPGIQNLLSGFVHFTYTTLGVLKPLQEQGKVRVVAIWGDRRSPILPDVPAITEVKEFANLPFTPSWHGIVGPANMPADVLQKLSTAIGKVTSDPDYISRMSAQGMEVVGAGPKETAERLKSDTASWQRIAKELDLKPE